MPQCFIDSCPFPKENTPLHLQERLSLVEHGKYQADFYPDGEFNAQDVVFDPKSVDITKAEKIVKDVCRSYNVSRINPPAPAEIMLTRRTCRLCGGSFYDFREMEEKNHYVGFCRGLSTPI